MKSSPSCVMMNELMLGMLECALRGGMKLCKVVSRGRKPGGREVDEVKEERREKREVKGEVNKYKS